LDVRLIIGKLYNIFSANFKSLTTEMRALSTQEKIMIAELAVLFAVPLLPNSVLSLTDNIIVRIILMGFVLASSFYGPYVLLLTFIVVLAIFGLRNHMKINRIMPPSVAKMAEVNDMVYNEPDVEVPIEQPPFQKPVQDTYDFSPQEDTGDNSFSPVDVSINQKIVMPSTKPDGRAGGLFPNP
jgi:hypothetical protein